MPLRSLERPLEVVEDRQELTHEPLVGVGDEPLLIADRALAVVLEVRLDALREIEVLVPLRRDDRERVGSRSLGLRLLDLRVRYLVGHDFAASSSSMTSKSASSTISSSTAPSPLPDGCAEPACAADACA